MTHGLSAISLAAPTPIAVLDVAYGPVRSAAACIRAADWRDDEPREVALHIVDGPPAPYEPGAFYKRELPLLLGALGDAPPALILIDGYATLAAEGRPGLGAHLHRALDGRAAVIGVAKSPMRGDDWSVRVARGQSRNPLYVTAVGLVLGAAAEMVAGMHGRHRLPSLVKRADQSARGALARR